MFSGFGSYIKWLRSGEAVALAADRYGEYKPPSRKPKITKTQTFGLWSCSGGGYVACDKTPEAAYARWVDGFRNSPGTHQHGELT